MICFFSCHVLVFNFENDFLYVHTIFLVRNCCHDNGKRTFISSQMNYVKLQIFITTYYDKSTITAVKMYSVAGILLSAHPYYISVRLNYEQVGEEKCIGVYQTCNIQFFQMGKDLTECFVSYVLSWYTIFFSSLLLSEICTIYNKVLSMLIQCSLFMQDIFSFIPLSQQNNVKWAHFKDKY